MKIVKFEGTPEEFKAVEHLFADRDKKTDASDSEHQFDRTEAITCMLRRRPVSDGQQSVYKALADGRLEYNQLVEAAGRTSGEMAGVLGALGRRISNTPEIARAGLPEHVGAVLIYERVGGELYIELQPHAKEALKAEGIL